MPVQTLKDLAHVNPALIVLDGEGVVRHISDSLVALLGAATGLPLPKEMRKWEQENPWKVLANGHDLSFFAESWAGYMLIIVTEEQGVYSGATDILNAIDEGIHVVNELGHTVLYNPAMAKLEGMDYSQVINKDVLALFPSLTPETSTILKVLRTKEPVHYQVQTYYNNKGQRITSLNSTIPLWHGEDFIGVLEVAKDVTRMEDLAYRVVDLQQRLYKRRPGTGPVPRLYCFADIIGSSPVLQRPLAVARRAAKSTSPVLIYGETGTGKELVAQSIHQASPRRANPFIAQNCAALPGTLLEGILFGTVKGGFTGAIDRPGLIEQADGGTLLLDEINSMGSDLQAKLLRVLQEHRVRRVGGLKEIPVDLRIVATTNTQPETAIRQGSIRKDLYYRLAVVIINLPPLHQRREDIPLLCKHFIDIYNERFGLTVAGITTQCQEVFNSHTWPGNVRELEHVIEGALNTIGEGESHIDVHHLPEGMVSKELIIENIHGLGNCTLPQALAHVEQGMIRAALDETGGNITQAARRLGITRQVLQYKLGKMEHRETLY